VEEKYKDYLISFNNLDIYDKRKIKSIKEYLGLSADWCNQYFREWKQDIFRALDYARKHNYEYILESDYWFYTETRTEIIKNFNGVIVYEILEV
jgi:hypothetical protein